MLKIARAYKVLMDVQSDWEDGEEYNALTLALESLEKQLNDRWIPVSQKLPEKHCEDIKLYNFQRVIATLKNGYVGEIWWTGTGFRVQHNNKFIELTNNPVIAWKALPEPYEGELNE